MADRPAHADVVGIAGRRPLIAVFVLERKRGLIGPRICGRAVLDGIDFV